MKKRKLIFILFSLFSLWVITACQEKVPQENPNVEQENPNENTDFDDFTPTGPVASGITLNGYTEDNYVFDNNITNENGSVCYEIFVRSFYDSDSDGIGDLNGVKMQLPYLKDLGIKTIWLMPIMPSPTYHGYDVTDYYNIESDYGTLADFEALVEEAEKLNIDIMIDIVFNHSSTQHPWFNQSAQDYMNKNTGPDSKADWYCWSDKVQSGYYKYSGGKLFYEARFDYAMPDFNTECEAVRNEMVNILKFWANKGVKGFRFDAVKYYKYNSSSYNANFLSYLRDEVVKDYPGCYFVGECWDSVSTIEDYYKSSFDSFFKFSSSIDGKGDDTIIGQAKGLNLSSKFGDLIENQEKRIKQNNPNAYSSYFISNHDMDRPYKSLEGDNAKMAASLTYLLPGTPYIYYGEEICLKGARNTSPDDQSDARRRLPMIWSEQDKTGECDFPEQNRMDLATNDQVKIGALDAQKTNYSVFNHYKKVIQIRNKYPFIKQSIFKNRTADITSNFMHILAYELSYEGKSIIVIHNFEKVNAEIDISKLNVTKILDEVSVSKLIPELSNSKLKLGKQSTVILG